MLKIAIVTVLYKSEDVLDGFYQSLSQQVGAELTVFAIDNSPTDEGTVRCTQLAQRYGVETITVFNNANLGVAKGNNQGIQLARQAGFDWVVLSNNDIEFSDPSMIVGMLEQMASHNAKAGVPKMLYFGTRLIWCAGGRISKVRAGAPHFGDMETDHGQFDQVQFTGYAPTCFMIINASVFETVGLMDEQYFVYYDDTDFVYRMSQKDLKVLYIPTYELFHKVSFSTGGNDSLFSLYYVTRNRLFFARKNFNLIFRSLAIVYTFSAMAVKSLRYSKEQRVQIRRGLKDGMLTKLARIHT